MDFQDSALLRLADPASRDVLLSQEALAAVVAAGYDHPEITGPYSAVFDEVDVMPELTAPTTLSGSWLRVGDSTPVELQASLSGPFSGHASGAAALTPAAPAVIAVWRGSVMAQVADATAPLNAAALVPLDLSRVDAAVMAALGGLPADPVALEAARREQVRLLVAAGSGQAQPPDRAQFDRWLELAGAGDVGAWLAGRGAAAPVYARLTFTATATQPSTRAMPVTVAMLARDVPVSVTALLSDSTLARQQLAAAALHPEPQPTLRQRFPFVVAWVVPSTWFDDPAWPGGNPAVPDQQRADRIAWATSWLAGNGIALITTEFT